MLSFLSWIVHYDAEYPASVLQYGFPLSRE
jgi:hypothetical protein